MQKFGLQVTSYARRSRKYSSYKEKIGTIAPNRIDRRFNIHIPHQKLLLIQLSLNTTKWILKGI